MNGTRVIIANSDALAQWYLLSLIGRKGWLVDEKRKNGQWVRLDYPFQGEKEWFIPHESIQVVKQPDTH